VGARISGLDKTFAPLISYGRAILTLWQGIITMLLKFASVGDRHAHEVNK
jgi:hypothetical protein